jgi:hypothetical protein
VPRSLVVGLLHEARVAGRMRPAGPKMSLASMPPERHYGHAVLMVIERPEGGYERKELWDPEGREWIREEEISTPKLLVPEGAS